jgi:hypothetical protein
MLFATVSLEVATRASKEGNSSTPNAGLAGRSSGTRRAFQGHSSASLFKSHVRLQTFCSKVGALQRRARSIQAMLSRGVAWCLAERYYFQQRVMFVPLHGVRVNIAHTVEMRRNFEQE